MFFQQKYIRRLEARLQLLQDNYDVLEEDNGELSREIQEQAQLIVDQQAEIEQLRATLAHKRRPKAAAPTAE